MTAVPQVRPQASVCDLGLPVGSRAWREAHVWSVARQVALARDGFQCVVCEATDYETQLHVHHVSPVGADGYGPGCQHHVDGLVTLCADKCHREIHAWLRAGCPDQQLALAV